MNFFKFLLVLCCVVFSAKTTRADVEDEEISPAVLQTILMSAYINETADPCDDFYEYACGNFGEVSPRLAGKGSSGVARGMDTEIENVLINIFETENEADNDVELKVKKFYKSCVDSDLFNFRKSDKVMELINSWGGFPAVDPNWSEDDSNWFKLNAELVALDINGIVQVMEERKMPALRLLTFGIEDIHDFDKEYTKSNKINIEVMKKLIIMYGGTEEQADEAVKGVLEFGKTYERTLAKYPRNIFLHNTKSFCNYLEVMCDLLDTVYDYKSNEPLTFSWDSRVENIYVFINYYEDKQSVHNYLILKALLEFHKELTKPKYIKSFCVDQVKKSFPFATSLMFLNSGNYNKNVEREVLNMIENIRKEFIESIKAREWIDEATKQRAIDKIENVSINIGIPAPDFKNWTLIGTLYNMTITSDYFSNILSIKRNQRIVLNAMGRKTYEIFASHLHDSMQAAYSGYKNSIMLTAGAFIPPLYIPDMPKSYNYAAIGITIGHEFTHALDGDDAEDQLNWEPQSLRNFNQRLSCIEDYFNNYVMEEIYTKINGTATRAENVADSGGMRHAYYAYQKHPDADHVQLRNDILSYLGVTENQFFFLSTAQLWCHSFSRKDAFSLKDDEHTHDKYRVVGTLAHFEEFAKAFNCPVGSKMNVKEKCEIW